MRRPLGVTALSLYFAFQGVILLGGAFVAILPRRSARFVWLDLFFGAAFSLIAWGLFRLREWARFCGMLVIFVALGARLPLYLLGPRRFDTSFFLILAEELLELVAVWYLFRSPTAKHFARPAEAA